MVEKAQALERAGCFSIVLECVPRAVAAAVTAAVSIPTIGIGAGDACSGQVLVYHDVLGFMQHPHHAKVTPKFCKQYARVGDVITQALVEFREDVAARRFPSLAHSPYRIKAPDVDAMASALRARGLSASADAAEAAFDAA